LTNSNIKNELSTHAIWIAWESHRRTEGLVSRLCVNLFTLSSSKCRGVRYLLFTIQTVYLITKHRPTYLFIQNPSWLLTFLTILIRPLFQYYLIVDAHNAGVYAYSTSCRRLNMLLLYFHRNADLTIVTNRACAREVENNGGLPCILPDLVPKGISSIQPANANKELIVTFICTYSADEPYVEVINAGHNININCTIFITGNHKHCPSRIIKYAPPNIHFTGYLQDSEYINLLSRSDLVMDLTTRDNCLVCGAYEAISFDKPLILSDTLVNRKYFNKGVLYTSNDSRDIAYTINAAESELVRLEAEIIELKKELNADWEIRFTELLNMCESLR
jgi:glycosyltransferase involved in cell wall biosynthesis